MGEMSQKRKKACGRKLGKKSCQKTNIGDGGLVATGPT